MAEITLRREQFLALQSMAHLASKDRTAPILMAVHLTVDGHGWIAEATDRYVLGRLDGEIVTSDLSEGESVTATIPAQWLLGLKPPRSVSEVALTLTPYDVGVSWNGAQNSALHVAGEYPDLSRLMAAGPPVPADTLSFRMSDLALFAKVTPASLVGARPAQRAQLGLAFTFEARVTRVRIQNGSRLIPEFEGAVMPMRAAAE